MPHATSSGLDWPVWSLPRPEKKLAASAVREVTIETRDLIGEFAGNFEDLDGEGIKRSARASVDLDPALLTRRELDVVVLVARGLNNQEIGAELFISENTVKTHLAHIFGKLGIRDRVQIAIFAYEHSLVLPKSL